MIHTIHFADGSALSVHRYGCLRCGRPVGDTDRAHGHSLCAVCRSRDRHPSQIALTLTAPAAGDPNSPDVVRVDAPKEGTHHGR